jgi:hypothetical protein
MAALGALGRPVPPSRLPVRAGRRQAGCAGRHLRHRAPAAGALAIYVEPGKLDQCGHAMAALKKSMRWDEERFGLEWISTIT